MKNKFNLFAIISLTVIISLFTAGCPKDEEENEPEEEGPTVTSVTITPPTGSVTKGANRYFYAKIIGTKDPAQTVTWSIDEAGKNSGTTISQDGLITVAAAETLTSLTVRATSTVDTAKSETATVTVTEYVFGGFNGRTLNTTTTATNNGYNVELWNQNNTGTVSMILGNGGTFKCSWNGVENVLFRSGKKFGSTQTHSQIGDISIEYNATSFSTTGSVGYLSVYGWVQNGSPDKLIEYYIVEKYGSYNPGSGGTSKGTVTIDGGTYTIYEKTMTGKPSIQGNNTNFKQYLSVRSSGRTSGTISVSQHFQAWADKGLVSISNGKLYEAALKVEGYQNNGSAEIQKNILSINGVPIN
ncbi:glycoside hydrolase family 11 protein [Treponema sp. R6D11]